MTKQENYKFYNFIVYKNNKVIFLYQTNSNIQMNNRISIFFIEKKQCLHKHQQQA